MIDELSHSLSNVQGIFGYISRERSRLCILVTGIFPTDWVDE